MRHRVVLLLRPLAKYMYCALSTEELRSQCKASLTSSVGICEGLLLLLTLYLFTLSDGSSTSRRLIPVLLPLTLSCLQIKTHKRLKRNAFWCRLDKTVHIFGKRTNRYNMKWRKHLAQCHCWRLQSFSPVIFNSDIQLSVFPMYLFVTLLKVTVSRKYAHCFV